MNTTISFVSFFVTISDDNKQGRMDVIIDVLSYLMNASSVLRWILW